ncbi:MATE family efflux transporter [Chitinophaga sancti]|uniref:Multidrug-efflux transporter n=1 Tax=Chitinophaga sancti TaxID=1004 RepID=A0A1K1NXM3_9BACT|nr:MATE family efflux transporter [Chitinophaga sancti]WQD60282.1 MATE family efflux transporter [Chitinophaga sancti]WQG87590.1 MATE family efflux transporter [Chitinophaga sancti]SFW40084.1 putative efflux protein, MATE family [Chitinophaga sancti]
MQQAADNRLRRVFRLFISAVSGTETEFATGSINRAIFLLSVPMILEMVMESLLAVVDIFFVSKLGTHAITTVGLTESILTIVYTIAFGMSMAATAVVARRTGEKNPDAAAHSAVQSLYIALVFSVLISIIGVIFAPDLLSLMGAPADVVEHGNIYTRMIMGSNLLIVLLFLINGIFRGVGDAAMAMRSLWIANIVNIILCPLLINGLGPIPAMGLTGAALAICIGRGVGVCYQLYNLFGGKGLIRISIHHLKPDFPVIGKLLKIAMGSTAQMLINTTSWIFLVRLIARFGEEAVAGYTVAIRVVIFTILPASGMANAAAALVGQNLGAGQPERAERSVWRAAFLNMIFLGGVSLFFILLARPVIQLFTQEEAVVAYGAQALQLVSMGYIFYAYGMVLSQSFNGAGDTRTPTIINLVGFWMFQMPLAWVLAVHYEWGPAGAFTAIAAAESAMAIASIIIFRKGWWKRVKV